MFEEFSDPRLALLYDSWGEGREDRAFYLRLASELGVSSVLDIGCGTGEISVALAERGLAVTGVDPARPMLAVARARRGGDLVRWVEGDAAAYDGLPVDLAIMTAHVAQVIHDEAAWRATLEAARDALVPGGHLAFESRHPEARDWEDWTGASERRLLRDSPLGDVEAGYGALSTEDDPAGLLARYEIRYHVVETGEVLVSHNALRFRTREAYEAALDAAGFDVARVYGWWDGSPMTAASDEMIFVARRRPARAGLER